MTAKRLNNATRILVVNPNSSESMTRGVEKAIRSMNLASVSDRLKT